MELIEKLESGLNGVKAHIDTQIEKVEADLSKMEAKLDEQAQSSGQVAEDLKGQYTNAEKLLTDLKNRQDAYELANNRMKGGEKGESFASAISKSLKENAGKISEYKANKTAFNLELDTKAAITMTEAASLTDEVIAPTRVPGVRFDPERAARVRQFLPTGSTDSNQIYFIQETYDQDGVNITAEGVAKPKSSFLLAQKAAPVVKIATHFKVSEEMLDDISYLASHISLRGTQKYANKEDQQLLYGTGQSGQLEGLTVSATDFALDQYTGDSNAQEYDILIEAVKQLRNVNYMPSAAMISVKRYFDMVRRKDDEGNYIMPEAVIFGQQSPVVQGVPIIATNALADNDFLVADFPQLTTLFDRKGVNVRFFDQNEDDAIKNLCTVVIEGRLALPTYLPGAGRYGNFATAIVNSGNS